MIGTVQGKLCAYLSPVQIVFTECSQILLRKRHCLDTLQNANTLDEHLEHTLLCLGAQLAVAQRDVDTRLECIVESFDAVRCEEENALEILQQAQEDGDEGIAVDVLDGALLEEDVSFVEKENCAPGMSYVENLENVLADKLSRCRCGIPYLLKFGLKSSRVRSKLTG